MIRGKSCGKPLRASQSTCKLHGAVVGRVANCNACRFSGALPKSPPSTSITLGSSSIVNGGLVSSANFMECRKTIDLSPIAEASQHAGQCLQLDRFDKE